MTFTGTPTYVVRQTAIVGTDGTADSQWEVTVQTVGADDLPATTTLGVFGRSHTFKFPGTNTRMFFGSVGTGAGDPYIMTLL